MGRAVELESHRRDLTAHTELVAHCPEASTADVDRAVEAAGRAFDSGPWPQLAAERAVERVQRLHDLYTANMTEMGLLITEEMGSPISFGQAGAAWMTLKTMLSIAETYPWEERRSGAFGEVLVRREAVGVVAAIVPWNVPQFIIMNKIGPALLAGCTVVLKPAPKRH